MRLAREEKKGIFIAMITIFVCLTAVFIFTLAKSQIIDGKKDTASNTASVESTEIKATRGQILDRNGKVIVGNRQGNDVVFNAADFPEYSKQEERNKLIKSLIDLFEKNKVKWNDDMPIVLDSNGNYQFAEDREKDIETMKSRDILRLNKYATADDCMNELVDRYKLESYSKADRRKIASVCYQMKINNFNSANPYVFATDVTDQVASVIKENSRYYKGVDIQIGNYREYTDGTLAPHSLRAKTERSLSPPLLTARRRPLLRVWKTAIMFFLPLMQGFKRSLRTLWRQRSTPLTAQTRAAAQQSS